MLKLEDLVYHASYDEYFICYNEKDEIVIEGNRQYLEEYDLDLEVIDFHIGNGHLYVNVSTETKTPLIDLKLSTRTYNALHRSGIITIEQLISLWENDKKKICTMRNIGNKCLEEISQAIQTYIRKEVSYEEK